MVVGPAAEGEPLYYVPVMDLLVTTDIASQVNIGFKFYAITDVYTSPRASTVVFPTTRVLNQGGFLRLSYNTATGVGMKLLYRAPYAANQEDGAQWSQVGYSTTSIGLAAYSGASCFVFYTPSFQSVVGISALTFRRHVIPPPDSEAVEVVTTGTPPPTCVVPCQFSFLVDYQTRESTPIIYTYAEAVTPMGAWVNAWQQLKWGPSTRWRTHADPAPSAYPTTVDALEEEATLVLQPGQLTAVAYRPYEVENGAFGGQWVLVATKPIPPHTRVFISINDWRDDMDIFGPNFQTIAYIWTSPPGAGATLPPGTVVDLTGLGTAFVHASIGTLQLGRDAPGSGSTLPMDIYAYTAYCGREVSGSEEDPEDLVVTGVHAVTATYPCSYEGNVPLCLIPGRDMLSRPWPDCPAILPVSACTRVGNWACEQLVLNTSCPVLWTTQPVPAFRPPPSACSASSCCCGPAPRPATVGWGVGCTKCGACGG
jgi:hypothetical protein